jgi:hypothetical protein
MAGCFSDRCVLSVSDTVPDYQCLFKTSLAAALSRQFGDENSCREKPDDFTGNQVNKAERGSGPCSEPLSFIMVRT